MYYFYFDASALVKRYTKETGSENINFIFSNIPMNQMMCFIMGIAELYWIFVRKKNDGRINEHDFSQANINLESEILDNNSDFHIIPIQDSLIFRSMPLIQEYSLNSVDAMLLRSAVDITGHLWNTGNRLVLVSSDQRLNSATESEGLLVFNPETDSQQDLTDWITY